jgi:signal transduction histidine kinase/CheY-like chemotaxis protein
MHTVSAGGVAPAAAYDQTIDREWLQDSARSSLVLVFAGASVLFLLFAVVGQILPRAGVGWIPIVDGITAVVLALAAVRLARAPMDLARMHVLGYGFAIFCIAHGVAASIMGNSPGDVTFAAFLVVGIGAVAVYWRPTLVLMAVAAASTVVTVAVTGGTDWLISTTILMATSALLGVAILSARLRAYAQIEQLRAADERRGAELADAVRQLQLELVERHRAEEERAAAEARLSRVQSLDALGTLAGGVAHGMNNVLAVVLGIAELGAAEGEPGCQATADFAAIAEAAHRGTDLTSNLLGFARRGKIRHAPFSLDDVIRDVVEGLDATMPAGVKVVLELEPVAVVGDPGQLSQAVLNICLNAVEAVGESGTIEVRLSAEPAGGSGTDGLGGDAREATAVLAITDDGRGMDEDAVTHAFQPFYAGRAADASHQGLGLAMVFGTVRDHGGEVSLQSVPGHGTTVVLRLPMAPAELDPRAAAADQGQSPSAPEAIPAGPAAASPILVVDDEPLVRHLVARMLELAGYACVPVDGGRAAVDRVSAAPGTFSLVVLDVAMPGMDGAATFEALRAIDPDLPILLASGYPKDRRVEDLLALGHASFLAKPFLREQLLGEVAAMRRAAPAIAPGVS